MADINDDEKVANRLVSLGYPLSIHDRLAPFAQRLIDIEELLLHEAKEIRDALTAIIENLPAHRYPDVAINRVDLDQLYLLKNHLAQWRSEHQALKTAGAATGALLLGDEPTD